MDFLFKSQFMRGCSFTEHNVCATSNSTQPCGICISLPILLQEIIADTVFVNGAGLSATDMYGYFSGPAFLPWNRMGNIDSW